MTTRQRMDEHEMIDQRGITTLAQNETQPGEDALMGPPPPVASEEPSTKLPTEPPTGTSTDQVAADPDTGQAEPVAEPIAQPVVLERSPNEGAAGETGAGGTSFWSISNLSGSSTLSGILMAGGVLILLFILMRPLMRRGGRGWRGRRKIAAAPPPTGRERIEAMRAQAEDRNQIDMFKVEAHEFTRQLASLLDAKAERLELLINDADERLARLAEMEGRPAPRTPEAGRIRFPRPDPPADGNPLHDRIYRLSDTGMDPIEIARQTGQPTGQVELILALRA